MKTYAINTTHIIKNCLNVHFEAFDTKIEEFRISKTVPFFFLQVHFPRHGQHGRSHRENNEFRT